MISFHGFICCVFCVHVYSLWVMVCNAVCLCVCVWVCSTVVWYRPPKSHDNTSLPSWGSSSSIKRTGGNFRCSLLHGIYVHALFTMFTYFVRCVCLYVNECGQYNVYTLPHLCVYKGYYKLHSCRVNIWHTAAVWWKLCFPSSFFLYFC